ncbi:Protein of unknown function [Solimonas aquatica]|uniref:DUF3570 domain-containing protein n=1 Tax=Solimonas aquatica TaxID=489703 RepID=A0A1H9GEK2_9GAMM|nr:DUF3570 domain-containing protein [Solimonas aquatica]SEQ48555.1 Protein of unknown function [Solimonas aquatica]
MQLNEQQRLRLAAATLSLLGVAGVKPAAAQEPAAPEKPWTFDTGLLLYKEGNGRVQAIEPVLNASFNLGGERLLSAGLVFDSLSGASPNGAAPAHTAQTFSSPSGGGQTYTTAAGKTPLDDTFHDQRVAANLGYQFPLSHDSKLGLGLRGSSEYDFTSFGANAHYSLDLNQKNTTLGAGVSFEYDQVRPVGGAPQPLSHMGAGGGGGDDEEGGSSKNKNLVDLLLGVTQVLDSKSLLQLNYSLGLSSGYQTDPYKVVSVVDANANPLYYLYESRPDKRTKHALYAEYKRFAFDRDVLDFSYRFFTDSWGINAHTLSLSYRWNFSEAFHLQPSLRFYRQNAADFYHFALFSGEDAGLRYASGDPRLGAFTGLTGGLQFGQQLRNGDSWNVRLEYYKQRGQSSDIPAQAAAAYSGLPTAPDMSAVILSMGYRFNW